MKAGKVFIAILIMFSMTSCIGYAKSGIKKNGDKYAWYVGFIKTPEVEMKAPTEGLISIGK